MENNNSSNVLEESVLRAVDQMAESSPTQVTKLIADLFKSSILKKYKAAFDQEVQEGIVYKEHLDKAIDFCFADACATLRLSRTIQIDELENEIKQTRLQLDTVKEITASFLIERGIEIKENSI